MLKLGEQKINYLFYNTYFFIFILLIVFFVGVLFCFFSLTKLLQITFEVRVVLKIALWICLFIVQKYNFDLTLARQA